MSDISVVLGNTNIDGQFPPEDAWLLSLLKENGYVHIKRMADGSYAGLFKFMYSWAVVADLHECGYEDRWCFHGFGKARDALAAWDGEGEPDGWHRHLNSGRRRNEDGEEIGRW